MSVATQIVGRTVQGVRLTDYGNVVTLLLDDGTYCRLESGDEYPLNVRFLDARQRVAETIDRRVAEYEGRQRDIATEIRREEQRVVRERMERLLAPKAYREWLRRHQPWYIMDKALKAMWTGPALAQQLYDADPFIGRLATIPVTK